MSIFGNPVLIGIGGEGKPFEQWDFTGPSPLVGEVRGLTLTQQNIAFDSTGANFSTMVSRIGMPIWANYVVEIDVASMSLSGGRNRRFIMASTQEGLVYRSTGYWGFWTESDKWEMFPESSGSLFDRSTVRVEIDSENMWHIYKNDVLLYEPASPLRVTDFHLGSTDDTSAINHAVISHMRLC